jgi:hypothetical protein
VLMICHEHAHLPRQSHKVRLHIWQVAGRFFDGWLDETKWRQKELSLASVHMYCTALKFGLWINHSPPPVTTVYYIICIIYAYHIRMGRVLWLVTATETCQLRRDIKMEVLPIKETREAAPCALRNILYAQ